MSCSINPLITQQCFTSGSNYLAYTTDEIRLLQYLSIFCYIVLLAFVLNSIWISLFCVIIESFVLSLCVQNMIKMFSKPHVALHTVQCLYICALITCQVYFIITPFWKHQNRASLKNSFIQKKIL